MKILYKIVSVEHRIFLPKINSVSEKQRNTDLAALTLMDRLLPALEEEQYAICVFLDHSACFDILSRSILYDKLERYGIRSISLYFIRAYLANKSQYVFYDTVKSSIRCQELGVIQGSKTGPRFFDIYIFSDFARMCSNDESVLYADDPVLVCVRTNLEELTDHGSNRLGNTLDWCNCNKLSLNLLNSEFMVVTYKRIETRPQMFIGADQVK